MHKIWSVDSQENYNAPNRLSVGAPPQTPLGELTALPQIP